MYLAEKAVQLIEWRTQEEAEETQEEAEETQEEAEETQEEAEETQEEAERPQEEAEETQEEAEETQEEAEETQEEAEETQEEAEETQEEAEETQETDRDGGKLLAMVNAETLPPEIDAGNIFCNDVLINSLFQNTEEPEEEVQKRERRRLSLRPCQ